MTSDLDAVYKSVLQWLCKLLGKQNIEVNKPLISKDEINQLIATAGKSKKVQQLNSNQMAKFGDQDSTVIGGGLDFADRRVYVSGDDPRYIDWKASARSQQTLLKNYFSEVNTAACIVIDRSSSMAFGTKKRLKITQAIRVAVTLGTRILRGGQTLACLVLDSSRFWQPAHSNLANFRKTIEYAARAYLPPEQYESDFYCSNISDCLNNHLPSGSRVIIVSDFFQLDFNGRKSLQQLNYHYELSAIQIIDQSEMALPSGNNTSLHYKGKVVQGLDNPEAAKKFNQELQQKMQQQEDWFKTNGIHFLRLQSHDDLEKIAGEF